MKPHFDRYSIHKIRPQRVGKIYQKKEGKLLFRRIYNTDETMGPQDGEQIRVLYTTPKN